MFQLPTSHIQLLLQSQTSLFMMSLGAGDFNYQTRDLTNGLYRERKSVAEKVDPRGSPKKFAPSLLVSQISSYIGPNINTTNRKARSDPLKGESHLDAHKTNSKSIHNSPRKTVEEIYKRYELNDTSGPQWNTWRDQRSRVRAYNVPSVLPSSPPEPHAEIYMDIHEERMEGLSYTFEEAPMSLST